MADITHTLRFSWSGSGGGSSISQTVVATGQQEENIGTSIPAQSVADFALDFIKDNLQSIFILSNQDLIFTTNGTEQVETAVIVGTIDVAGAGNATVTVTAAAMTNSPKAVSVAVANNDTASQVATKIRTALRADADVGAFFQVGGTGADVVLTAFTAAANDATMNCAYTNGTCTGLTPDATSNNTTAGVAHQDTFSLTANEPMVWYAGCGLANPFAGDVTGAGFANLAAAAATLSVRMLEAVP